MGFGSFFKRAARVVSKVADNPIGGLALGLLPGGAAIGMASSLANQAFKAAPVGRASSGMAMSALTSSALPSLPGIPTSGGYGGGVTGGAGVPTVFDTQKGAAGGMAAPALTIDLIRQLESAGLMTGFNQLRTFHRSPRKDQVVVHWPGGGTVALNKKLARKWGLWKPAGKPPISVGEINSIRKANRVVHKLQKLERDVKKVANFGVRRPTPKMIPIETRGKVIIGRKVK